MGLVRVERDSQSSTLVEWINDEPEHCCFSAECSRRDLNCLVPETAAFFRLRIENAPIMAGHLEGHICTNKNLGLVTRLRIWAHVIVVLSLSLERSGDQNAAIDFAMPDQHQLLCHL